MAWEEFFLCSDITDSELPWNTSDCLETPATSPVGSLQDTFSLGLDGGTYRGLHRVGEYISAPDVEYWYKKSWTLLISMPWSFSSNCFPYF